MSLAENWLSFGDNKAVMLNAVKSQNNQSFQNSIISPPKGELLRSKPRHKQFTLSSKSKRPYDLMPELTNSYNRMKSGNRGPSQSSLTMAQVYLQNKDNPRVKTIR